MSTLKTITVIHPSSAVNNIVNDASGNVAVGNNLTVAGTATVTGATTLTGNVTATGTLVMGSSFKRNRIINGNMVVDQRNAGASVTVTSFQFSVDRWQAINSQSSKFSVQQNAGSVTPPVGFSNYLGCTSLSAYSVSAADNFLMIQKVEGYNVADFAWGTANAKSVTLSFWAYSSLTGTFGAALQNSANTRSYPFSYTISAANTWTYVTVTVPGDTSGTWLVTNGAGVQVTFNLGCGSNYLGTANAWAATSYYAPTGAVSVVGTSGATFYITGVQLEVGTKATPYEMQIYSDQLAQCQRYYEYGFGIVAYNGDYSVNYFKVTKRSSPTCVISAYGGTILSGPNADLQQVNVSINATTSLQFTATAEL